MKCEKCPLLHRFLDGEHEEKDCILFGYEWDSEFQYEDANGTTGCYIDFHYIEKVARLDDDWKTSKTPFCPERKNKNEGDEKTKMKSCENCVWRNGCDNPAFSFDGICGDFYEACDTE